MLKSQNPEHLPPLHIPTCVQRADLSEVDAHDRHSLSRDAVPADRCTGTGRHPSAASHRREYRADWEPATTSGKCMAGVPGVFWRCPAVLQGPSTHNPAWFQGKPILLKIGRFSLYACGNGVDLPHLAKRAFRDQIGPNVQKAMLLGSPSHQGLKNCGFSQKYFFSFLTIFFSFW